MSHPRLENAFNKHRSTLGASAPAWGLEEPEALFNRLAAADPSDDSAYGHGKKLYLDWLLRQVKAGRVQPDNLSEVTLALRVFVATPHAGDLNRFTTPNALAEAMLGPPRRQLEAMLARQDHLEMWRRLEGFSVDFALGHLVAADFALGHLVAADPGGGRHLPHLLRWLGHPTAPLLPEDLPRVQSHLELYLHNRQRLTPATKRDLAACATARDLGGLIAPFRKDTTYTLEERRDFEKTALENGEAVQVAETPHFRLLHITTEAGAKRLGKGTEWCTSWGDGNGRQNHFKTYADNLLYLRSKHDGSVYQLHFRSWQLMDAQDDPINDFGAFARQHPGLFSALAPFALPVLPATLTKAAENGWVDRVVTLLAFCKSDPDYKHTADTVAETVLPAALTKAAENGWADRVVTLLAFCKSDPDYKRAAISVIPAALTKAAERGWADRVATLLAFCKSDPDYKRAAISVIPAALTKAAENGWADRVANLLPFCKSDPDYKRAAISVIPTALTQAAAHGWADRVATLLPFCKSDPDYKRAANTVAETVIPTALTKAAENGWADRVANLLTFCKSDPAWATIARA